MNHFAYRGKTLFAEELPLSSVAEFVGTPTYVYSTATLERHVDVISEAFSRVDHLLCYAVKACSNLAILALFAERGAGFDIVSGGELARVLAAGGDPRRVVFSGVGKTLDELDQALAAGIRMFNVESAEELRALDAVGRRRRVKAPFALRVIPNVDARTHRHITTGHKATKFGVPFAEAAALYAASKRMKGVVAVGLDYHIGSQVTDARPVRAAIRKVAELYRALLAKGHALKMLDVGGGLGITYDHETPPSPAEYARLVLEGLGDLKATLILEPGRVLVGNAGVLLTQVLYRKKTEAKQFVIVDAGMNDLVRPALYDAVHAIQPVERRAGRAVKVDVVGPVCESTDVLAKGRPMVLPRQGDLLAVMTAGAYGMSMASTYNSRPRPAEVLVRGGAFRVIRERELPSDLFRGESP